ncbi:hypothetical protein PAAG_03329 [Paracoccidioides lutzii Pb01]|uniref:Uncharacterized protein n=1 Tax=Paracoccidioides lutzii (strain ATCC MYA-826 / Pb01) TaxID=502779 RepID=C1GWV5_PARBA|nr:hypothetical protein PAAG_03329 [Paracoccidioides lutzii Pb01]EEH41043.2 hypothetical protein PAAG_03329 [Paracoccidioides lutzii Pb01]
MGLPFAADKPPWTWDADRTFAQIKEENPDLVLGTDSRKSTSVVDDPETGKLRARELIGAPMELTLGG